MSTKNLLLNALNTEIIDRANEIPQSKVSSIYFGGGTPSVLDISELEFILKNINSTYSLGEHLEITLEANPDDLNLNFLRDLKKIGINRLSIGIQSFQDADLQFMNRAHNAEQSHFAIQNSIKAGFNNISCDLIFGIPMCSHELWITNIHSLFNYKIPHLSCYALTIEENTKLHFDIRSNKIKPLNDSHTVEQMEILLDEMASHDYEAYEISNYCKKNFRSQHNSNYWKNGNYLGFGPSAHSYNGSTRRWNIANNLQYIQNISEGKNFFEFETLSLTNKYNEYLMLNLRKMEGIDMNFIQSQFPEFFPNLFKGIQKFIINGSLIRNNESVYLSNKGKYISDHIIRDLFEVE